jgi:tRNA threonylcarbamoyl adenosine modification protein YjeE
MTSHLLVDMSEADVAALAGLLAFAARPGDTVALEGDLGAGKTTFARALVRALTDDEVDEIPSPTFTVVQSYETARMGVLHADLYRLSDASELAEIGLDPAPAGCLLLVEWPERAADRLDEDRLEVRLTDAGKSDAHGGGLRDITLVGQGTWGPRARRLAAMNRLVADWRARYGAATLRVRYMQGDASARRYARLVADAPAKWAANADAISAILMDAPRQPDGPPIRDGLPYSRIAHLAEDVRPFIAVAGALTDAGITAPSLLAHDMANGLLIISDLGERVFGAELAAGTPQETLWRAATDVLVALRAAPPPAAMPLPDGTHYTLPTYDRGALAIETELLVDWYWPFAFGAPPPADARAEFTALWDDIISRLVALPRGWVLRDYHSPNLIWRPEQSGLARVGVIDFQDALSGPSAYDLVSLLQDARLDVPPALEAALIEHYCAAVGAREPGFEREAFLFAYAALGAQRNTKIAGIFARLARRDGKPQYLAHLPRIWRYLERDLAHPGLARLEAWYDRHLPAEVRRGGITR